MEPFPEKFNMASYFLDDRLREGKGEKVAVRSRRRSMTYQEVVRESHQVANVLRDLHRRMPTVPFVVVGKEVSMEDTRLTLSTLPGRFADLESICNRRGLV